MLARCFACNEGAPDSCLTGDYSERGITRLHGFARELVAEDPAQLIAIPRSLGRLGVLVEPASICERGIRHARTIGGRQPWELQRALVIGTGAIGMLSTYLLRLAGLDVWTAGRSPAGDPRPRLAAASGASYVSTATEPLSDAAGGGRRLRPRRRGDRRRPGDGRRIGLLRRNGVACLLGLDARRRSVELDGRVIGVDAVIENRVVFGSVNAHRIDWLGAVESLERIHERWPDEVQQFVGLRVPLDRFAEAFGHYGGQGHARARGLTGAAAPMEAAPKRGRQPRSPS